MRHRRSWDDNQLLPCYSRRLTLLPVSDWLLSVCLPSLSVYSAPDYKADFLQLGSYFLHITSYIYQARKADFFNPSLPRLSLSEIAKEFLEIAELAASGRRVHLVSTY